MADQATIQYISGLINRTVSFAESDKARIASLVKEYPYMAPLRYIEAAHRQINEPWSAEMLATAEPYIGNWLQFCALIDPRPAEYVNIASDNDTIESLVEIAINDSE